MQQDNSYQPVIIIGAPRSGTNILRDVLCRLPNLGTWPCDEINYIWRHGNAKYPNDAFPPALATGPVKAYIRNQFDLLHARNKQYRYVVEKTCANSLRVGFVHAVIPEAKIIYIVRNGMDAVASAKKCWKRKLDPKYIFRKAKYVPATDIPYYAGKYLLNRIYKLVGSEQRLAYWGPRLEGVSSETYSLAELCALQWRDCVSYADTAITSLPADQVHMLRYEDFVKNPSAELGRIAEFLLIDAISQQQLNCITSDVLTDSVGKFKQELTDEEKQQALAIMKPLMQKHGYI